MTRYPTFFNFNPRAPYGARPCPAGTSGEPAYFNPRAPYGARLRTVIRRTDKVPISIHAPHTGRDSAPPDPSRPTRNFNPRAPYGARPPAPPPKSRRTAHFNPRAPYGARRQSNGLTDLDGGISIHAPHTGRDRRRLCTLTPGSYFNPRAPYGARRPRKGADQQSGPISIHAPHTGRDTDGAYKDNLRE